MLANDVVSLKLFVFICLIDFLKFLLSVSVLKVVVFLFYLLLKEVLLICEEHLGSLEVFSAGDESSNDTTKDSETQSNT